MHKFLLCCCFYIWLNSISAQTLLSPSEVESLTSTVKKRAQQTQTLVCDFTQYKHLSFLSSDIESSGELKFKKPNLVKWAYKSPYNYTVLFKDEQLYINDNGNKSKIDMSASAMFEQLNSLIVNSINGTMFQDKNFKVKYYKENNSKVAHFIPLEEGLKKFIKEIELYFNDKGDVMEVKMIEPSNDYTRIELFNKEINTSLPDEIFNP